MIWNEDKQETVGVAYGLHHVDYIPIVRCKDCKHGHICINGRREPMVKCELMPDEWLHEPEWFCADGERSVKLE